MRVQIPAYTDRWMMGDRFGEVVKTTKHHAANDPKLREIEIVHVKLDISGKVVRVVLADCQEVK